VQISMTNGVVGQLFYTISGIPLFLPADVLDLARSRSKFALL